MPVLRLEADMRRREFIILLGCAAAWPAAAIAQQDNKKRLVGLITAFNEKEMMPLVVSFAQGCKSWGGSKVKTLFSMLGPRAETMRS